MAHLPTATNKAPTSTPDPTDIIIWPRQSYLHPESTPVSPSRVTSTLVSRRQSMIILNP